LSRHQAAAGNDATAPNVRKKDSEILSGTPKKKDLNVIFEKYYFSSIQTN